MDRYHIVSTGKFATSPPRFIRGDDVGPGHGSFASVYSVSASDAQAIQQAGTATGYRGVVWSQRLWIDCDTAEASRRTEEFLIKEGYDYEVYDSGRRGYHFGVARVADPSHLLPARDKQWVRANCPDADLSLYTHLHLFRIAGSTHEETGRLKSFLRSVRGRSVELPAYIDEKRGTGAPQEYSTARKSAFTVWQVHVDSMPASPGLRHQQLVRLTYTLRDKVGMTEAEACWWAREVNRSFSEPKDEDEVERIVRGIYRG